MFVGQDHEEFMITGGKKFTQGKTVCCSVFHACSLHWARLMLATNSCRQF